MIQSRNATIPQIKLQGVKLQAILFSINKQEDRQAGREMDNKTLLTNKRGKKMCAAPTHPTLTMVGG